MTRTRRLVDRHGRPLRAAGLYEGATYPRTGRSTEVYSAGLLRDTSTQVNATDWKRLLGTSRFLYASLPLVNAAVNEVAAYSVGQAFLPQYRGSDPAWGEQAAEWLIDWYAACDVRGDGYDLQTDLYLASIAVDRDGDVLVVLTWADGNRDYPMVQFVPAHRIGSRGASTGRVMSGPYAGLTEYQGVILNRHGRPVAARVLGDRYDDDRYLSLRDAMLVYEPAWFDQGRGLPALSAGLRDWTDFRDYRDYEKIAAKMAASIGLVEYNERGSADAADNPFEVTENASGTGVTLEELDGGAVRYFRANSGAGLKSFTYDRPAANTREFVRDGILRGAFSSLGWPLEFGYDSSLLTGPSVRLVIAKAARKISARQRLLRRVWRRVVVYALAKAIKSGALPASADWWAWEPSLPRMVTIDHGRDTGATLASLTAGTTTLSRVYGEEGADWKREVEQRIAEERYIQDRCAEEGVDPDRIFKASTPPANKSRPEEKEEEPE